VKSRRGKERRTWEGRREERKKDSEERKEGKGDRQAGKGRMWNIMAGR
jgi:hypothetical protein